MTTSAELIGGTDLPRHEAERLLIAATNRSRIDLHFADDLGPDVVDRFHSLVERRLAGVPLQYIEGHTPFGPATIDVDPRVLIPRPETELVAEVALGKAATSGPTRVIADLGTGSGAIGLALAHELPRTGTTVWLTDVSDDALDVARANTAGIGPAGVNVRIASGSWLDALPADVRCDVIVSNPPYVAVGSPDLEPLVGDWEPHQALFAGADGLDDIRTIVGTAPARLYPGGWIVLEIGADQGDAVAELLSAAGFIDVEILPDLAGLDRVALGRRS